MPRPVENRPVPARCRRRGVPILVAWLLAAAVGAPLADQAGDRHFAGAPDLVIGRGDLVLAEDGLTLTATVHNRGTQPSPSTVVRLGTRPPFGPDHPGPYVPRHRFLRDETGLVIWPDRTGPDLVVRVRWQGQRERDRFGGKLRLVDAAMAPLTELEVVTADGTPAPEGTREADGWVSWSARGAGRSGLDIVVRAGGPAAAMEVHELTINGVPNLHGIYVGNWWLSRYYRNMLDDDDGEQGSHPGAAPDTPGSPLDPLLIPLDDPRLTAVVHPAEDGHTAESGLPPLDPGARARVVFVLPGPEERLYVSVDPEDAVLEEREGNNIAWWKAAGTPAMVSLHTHSSLSEGYGSFDAQMDSLSRAGYDAVVWTDHDWRLLGLDMPDRMSFESPPGEWSPVAKRLDPGLEAELGVTTERATDGSRSLRLEARRVEPLAGAPPEVIWALRRFRARMIRSLAKEVSVAFDVYADTDNPFDVEFIIRLQLSDQPHVRRFLDYRLDVLPDAPVLPQVVLPPPNGGEPGRVSIPPRRWVRVVIPASTHARARLPEGVDNNLSSFQIGLALRGGRTVWDVDNLTFEAALRADELLQLESAWGRGYPAVDSHVATEISFYVPHFNAFTPTPVLLDYDGIRREFESMSVARQSRVPQRQRDPYGEAARQRTLEADGALSVNHPLGFNVRYPDRAIEAQLRNRFSGADLVEVGYRYRAATDLAGHLAFWDRALAEGIPASGVGVTDAHGAGRGNGYERDENNFATWIDTRTGSMESLIDGLLAGRLTFGDPILFRGSLELEVDGRYRGGDVVVVPGNPPAQRPAVVRGGGLLPGGRIELVVDGEVAVTGDVDASGDAELTGMLPAGTRAVRAACWGPDDEPVAFTNAILLVETLPPDLLPASRLRVELPGGGLLSAEGDFRLDALRVGQGQIKIEGTHGVGRLQVRGAGRAPRRVRVAGTTGDIAADYRADDDLLTVPLAAPGVEINWVGRGVLPWWAYAVAAGLAALLAFWFWRRR